MDYGIVIEKIHQELKAYWGKGKVADYIPVSYTHLTLPTIA